jgi:hypothetical protein
MTEKHRLNHVLAASLALVFLFVFSCGGAKGGGATEPLRTGNSKYDTFFEKADKLEKDIVSAKETIEKARADLAVAVGLKADAPLGEIRDAIKKAIETAVVKAGGHVEVTIEGGIFASAGASLGSEGASAGAEVSAEIKVTIAIVGDVQASAEVQKIIDAGKISLTAVADTATKLKAISGEAPDLITEAGELSTSCTADFDPIMAAKVTARLTGLTNILKEASGLFDTSFSFTIEVKASYTMEGSAGAGAEGSAGAGAGTE